MSAFIRACVVYTAENNKLDIYLHSIHIWSKNLRLKSKAEQRSIIKKNF